MSHPQSCHDPNCTLTYREHLLGFHIGGKALVTRGINRTPGMPDEPLTQTLTREKRWERDHEAYRRLHNEGYRPPKVEGSRLRELKGETLYDINERPVKIDYSDAR